MTIEQKIKMLIGYVGVSQAEIARRIGMTPSNFNQKVKRETFTQEEMNAIAKAAGVKWEAVFILPDGTKI